MGAASVDAVLLASGTGTGVAEIETGRDDESSAWNLFRRYSRIGF